MDLLRNLTALVRATRRADSVPPLPTQGTEVSLAAEQMALVWIAVLREGKAAERRLAKQRHTPQALRMFMTHAVHCTQTEARKSITTHHATGGRNAARLLAQLSEAML